MSEQSFLLECAFKNLKKSYSPYSNFPVGAALLTDNGKVYPGTNIENASFGATICAERVAVFSAIADGAKSLKAIAVVSEKLNPCFPCGICRQVFVEFSPEMEIIMLNKNGELFVMRASELLPSYFILND